MKNTPLTVSIPLCSELSRSNLSEGCRRITFKSDPERKHQQTDKSPFCKSRKRGTVIFVASNLKGFQILVGFQSLKNLEMKKVTCFFFSSFFSSFSCFFEMKRSKDETREESYKSCSLLGKFTLLDIQSLEHPGWASLSKQSSNARGSFLRKLGAGQEDARRGQGYYLIELYPPSRVC